MGGVEGSVIKKKYCDVGVQAKLMAPFKQILLFQGHTMAWVHYTTASHTYLNNRPLPDKNIL